MSNLAVDLSSHTPPSNHPRYADRYKPSAALTFFTKFVVWSLLALIFIGSLVTSHGAGLSVPDWPTTYGQNMFLYPIKNWVGGILYEHGHRLFASGVGTLILIQALWLSLKEKRRWVRNLGLLALGAVILQGVLGGMTVLYRLPDWISMSHALLAQSILALCVVIAYAESREFFARKNGEGVKGHPTAFKWCLFGAGLIFVQLFLGAWMRHAEAGLAVPGFPDLAGSYSLNFDQPRIEAINAFRRSIALSPVDSNQILIHLSHRFFALFVAAYLLLLGLRISTTFPVRSALRNTGLALGVLVAIQFLLGAWTIWSLRAPYIASLHVATGAALLALCTLAALRSFTLKESD